MDRVLIYKMLAEAYEKLNAGKSEEVEDSILDTMDIVWDALTSGEQIEIGKWVQNALLSSR